MLRVDLRENPLLSRQLAPKIPNANDSLLSQAKYVLYQQHQADPSTVLDEIALSKVLSKLHSSLLMTREEDFNKQNRDLQVQNSLLGQQLQAAMRLKLKAAEGGQPANAVSREEEPPVGGQQLEEVKRLREENTEIRSKAQYLEQDLLFQAQKTRDIQSKFEGEIENLRA